MTIYYPVIVVHFVSTSDDVKYEKLQVELCVSVLPAVTYIQFVVMAFQGFCCFSVLRWH